MAETTGWQSKDIITWMILIWGFYRLANPSGPTMAGAGCQVPGMTQTGLQAPSWINATGQAMTIETP